MKKRNDRKRMKERCGGVTVFAIIFAQRAEMDR
jgi:hypothetical protein